ncbi:MAG: type III pantothenate kinase [Pseudomonadota bacterium]
MSYLLAIDSGNSYVKWGLHDGNQWLKQGKVFYDTVGSLEKEFIDLPVPTSIVISHVARAVTRNELNRLISIWPITKPQWITTHTSQCGVSNGYSNSNQLGSDRWAALIAAWKIQCRACLVINVGTAVTVDVLSESGKFLGGIILPGIHLMLKSLQAGTQLINVEMGDYEDFPVNTNDAIQSGVMQCLLGAIDRMYNLLLLQQDHSVGNCIISGGGASILVPFIKFPINVVDNLVLEGLVIIAADTLSNKKTAIS